MSKFEEKESNVPEKKNNEANTKKAWQTPEIFDLDLDKTRGKVVQGDEWEETTGPS